MRNFLFTFIIFTMLPNALKAQQPSRKNLKGKVIADFNNLDGIYVFNIKTEDATTTQDGGYFSLPVKVGDTLMLSSIRFKGIKIGVTDADLLKELVFVKMQPLMNKIEEVTVLRYKNINAVALGIIPAGQRSYTAAERKLKASSDWDYKGASVSIDPLLNLFSGRTAMLRKELIVEGKETALQKIENMFEQEYFTLNLKIPEEYVKGFQYYLVENNRFVELVEAKNKSMARFIMGELAVKYLEIVDCENK